MLIHFKKWPFAVEDFLIHDLSKLISLTEAEAHSEVLKEVRVTWDFNIYNGFKII